jgi:Fe-S-cluster containining protein
MSPRKITRKAKDRPPAAEGLEWDARRSQRLRTAEILRGGRTPLQVIAVADAAAAIAGKGMETALERDPPRPPLACAEGCDWCCHKVVGCAAPEALRIVAYLRESLSVGDMQAVVERIVQRDDERRVLRHDSWSARRLPCPLLVNHRCSVYPVRPLTCRGFNSSDARLCERSLKVRDPVQIPTHGPSHQLATFVLAGMRSGLGEAGLKADLLELTAALRVALTVPDAAEKWLGGEVIFDAALLDRAIGTR